MRKLRWKESDSVSSPEEKILELEKTLEDLETDSLSDSIISVPIVEKTSIENFLFDSLKPNSPNYWKKFFPFESYRKYQPETIKAIIKAWASGKRYVIVEGTTGSGKSCLAITLGRLMGEAFIATPQKILQDQYIRDFKKYLVELKGRNIYPCLRIAFNKFSKDKLYLEKNLDYITLKDYRELPLDSSIRKRHAANAPCCTYSKKEKKRIKNECAIVGCCPYLKQRDKAAAASFTLMNFSNLVLFSLLMRLGVVFRQRDLLILDECHLMEDRLVDFASHTIACRAFKPLKPYLDLDDYLRINRPFSSLKELISFLENTIFPALQDYQKDMKIMYPEEEAKDAEAEELSLEDRAFVEDGDLNEMERMALLYTKLKGFVKLEPTDDTHVMLPLTTLSDKGEEISCGTQIKPFSVASLGESLAFYPSRSKVLLMSATILDVDIFCKSLGIPLDQACFIRVPSTFPAKNRPIIHDSVGSLGHKYIDENLPFALAKTVEICNTHERHKGLIHPANYKINYKLKEFVKRNDPELFKRMRFQQSASDKNMLLNWHLNSTEPTILCGPGFLEGLDLKDDLARFQILIKMPYLSLGDPFNKRKLEFDPEWYQLRVALNIIQAVGRAVRSETDWAIFYILDGCFGSFFKRNPKLFPPYIKETVQFKRNV